jgi:hypothetical protein
MMNKKNLPHIITVVSFVVFIVLGLACATTPKAQIELSANYQKYLQQPSGNERAFDEVGVEGRTSFVCRDGSHNITPQQQLGATYEIGGQITTKNKAAEASAPSERHRHEPALDQLLNEAKRQYPNETIDIRSAKTVRHIPTNPRQEKYTDSVKNSDGSYTSVERTRTVWDCFPYYVASVITTEPWPQPVTYSENFTKPGSTRADIYRWAINWLEDNKTKRKIVVESEDLARGRIKGTVTCDARTDQTYIVTSGFIIDVYDARVEIKFDEAILRRTDAQQEVVGDPERIFLQSIADAAQAEITDFATTLKSVILSR